MFGFSWSEILIIGVVALVFIGPNDLPKAMKTAARWMSAGRKLAREFQGHVDDLVREAELDELREQARKLAMTPLSSHLESYVDPNKEISKALAPPDNLHEILTGVSTTTTTPAETPPTETLPGDAQPAIAAPELTISSETVPSPAPTPELAAESHHKPAPDAVKP